MLVRRTLVGAGVLQHVGFLFGEPLVEGLAFAFFAGGHPELVRLAPVVGRGDDGVAVVIADLVGVGRFAWPQGVVVRHGQSIALGPRQLNTYRGGRHIGHSVGPPRGMTISLTTWKPNRS